MQAMFAALLDMIREPLRAGGVQTDNSILLIYPPENELDFREYLLDTFVPLLDQQRIAHRLLNLTGFVFDGLDQETIENLQQDEFDHYRWMQQGLSKRVEAALIERLREIAAAVPGGVIIVYATMALYPLVRLGEALRGLRDINCRIVTAFPGEQRGGKLHFMNQPDGGNYLAVKLFWR
jgi:hypothetical protein